MMEEFLETVENRPAFEQIPLLLEMVKKAYEAPQNPWPFKDSDRSSEFLEGYEEAQYDMQESLHGVLRSSWSPMYATLEKIRREHGLSLDKYRLRNRPAYPTLEQEEGIREALQHVATGGKDGYPIDVSHSVRVTPRLKTVDVLHNAPSKESVPGGVPLWEFSLEEIDTLTSLFLDGGYNTVSSWNTDEGTRFVLEPVEEKNV